MRTFILFTFSLFLGVCHGAPLDPGTGVIGEAERPHCRIVIEKDGIESAGVVSAWGGALNQVYCKVECEGKSVAPAPRWFRQTGSDWKQLRSYSNSWVYAVRRHFDTWSVLTFPNFLIKNVGQYKCTAWLGAEQGLQSREVYVGYGCPPDSFFCDNFMCLPRSKTCDGIKHCKDGRDEAGCLYCDPVEEFSCDNKCMDISDRCDGVIDCIDETDERGCVCNETTQFTCDDGACIDNAVVCDGFEDCLMDGSDEYPDLCKPDEVSTTTTSAATESATEASTSITTTSADTTTTTTTTIAPTTTVSEEDYYNYDADIDTTVVPTTTVSAEEDDYYYNADIDDAGEAGEEDDNDSIQESTTLQDNNDESITTTTTTKPETTTAEVDVDITTEKEEMGPDCIPGVEFKCNNGECIPMDWFCDTLPDCDEGEDEINCTTSQDGCLESQFQCDEGMCIMESSECDGVLDCPFGEDEEGCDGCLPEQFMCNDGQCIDINGRCDDIPDCNDTSDEQNCFEDGGISCMESKMQCEDGLKCYTTEQRCDGSADCNDASDEKNCSVPDSPSGSPGQTGVGQGEVVSGLTMTLNTGEGTEIVEEEEIISVS